MELVALLQLTVGTDQTGDLNLSILAHALKGRTLSASLFDLGVDSVDLHFKVVYFAPDLTDSLLIDFNLDFMLIFSALLLVK